MDKLCREHVHPRFQKWCDRHGFKFVVIRDNVTERKPAWTKVFWLREYMPFLNNGDIVAAIDSDVCLMDSRESPEFEKDFSVPMESTGALCMGFWSARVCEWTRRFIEEICCTERHLKNLQDNPGMWLMFNENEALYQVLGLGWDYPKILEFNYGERKTTPFTKEELQEHFGVLHQKWNVSFDPFDPTDGSCLVPFFKPERYWPHQNTIIRHFAAGTIHQVWAQDYFKEEMK